MGISQDAEDDLDGIKEAIEWIELTRLTFGLPNLRDVMFKIKTIAEEYNFDITNSSDYLNMRAISKLKMIHSILTYSILELTDLVKRLGLPESSKKEELIARIKEAFPNGITELYEAYEPDSDKDIGEFIATPSEKDDLDWGF